MRFSEKLASIFLRITCINQKRVNARGYGNISRVLFQNIVDNDLFIGGYSQGIPLISRRFPLL